jgi:hypothetical protein
VLPDSQSPHGPHPPRYTALPRVHSAYRFEAKHMDHTYAHAQMYMDVCFSIPVLKHLPDLPSHSVCDAA